MLTTLMSEHKLVAPTKLWCLQHRDNLLSQSEDFNPSDVSHDFGLMGATFERKLNQIVDRNAETDVGVEILSVTMSKQLNNSIYHFTLLWIILQ